MKRLTALLPTLILLTLTSIGFPQNVHAWDYTALLKSYRSLVEKLRTYSVPRSTPKSANFSRFEYRPWPTNVPHPTSLPTETPTPTPISTPCPVPTLTPTLRPIADPTALPLPTPTVTPEPTKLPTPTPTPSSTSEPIEDDDIQTYLINAVNEYCRSQGLSEISRDSYTCEFAKVRAQEISATFNHNGFSQRIDASTLPYPNYVIVTENIARHSDYRQVVPMWIASSGHARNMREDTPFVCIEKYGEYYAYEGWKPLR
ncbi:MAG: CAP domain-containing protein [Patescibacteria group bacterium]|jgi:hypothetical protein